MKAINEPSHVECGAPDFIVELNGVPIGHIECKNVGADLNDVEESEQLKRYREGLPNLILTDYVRVPLVRGWLLASVCAYWEPERKRQVYSGQPRHQQFPQLLGAFFNANVPTINNPRDLAKRMAAKARLLYEGVYRILAKEGQSGSLFELWTAYREILIADLSPMDFADLQAQTAAYGMFAARCSHKLGSGSFSRQSAIFAETTPFLKSVFLRIAGPEVDPRIAWIVDDLAQLLDRHGHERHTCRLRQPHR